MPVLAPVLVQVLVAIPLLVFPLMTVAARGWRGHWLVALLTSAACLASSPLVPWLGAPLRWFVWRRGLVQVLAALGEVVLAAMVW